MDKPFTTTETEIINHLVDAHNLFLTLEETHPMEQMEWTLAVHQLQNVLGNRILRRDYPKTYPTYKKS